jgi:hypothetical protein
MATPVKYNLVFYVSGKQWRVTPVSLKKPICFGMSEKCNVRLSSTGTLDLLDEHAWLLLEGSQIYLKVAGKTKLNGEDVAQGQVPYSIGDKIQFGEKEKLILVLELSKLEQGAADPAKKEKRPKEKKPAAADAKTKSPKEIKKTAETEKAEPMLIEGAKKTEVVGEPKTSEDTGVEQTPVVNSTEGAPTVEESPKASPKNQKGSPKTPKAKAEVIPKSPRKPVLPKETKTKTPPKEAKAAAKVTPSKPAKVVNSPKTPKQTKAPVSPKSGGKSKESSQSLFPTGKAAAASSPTQEEKRGTRSASGTPSKATAVTPSKSTKPTQQTDEVVEITENGNTYKIPPFRTREEVDKMELDDILLEMVSLSRGHDAKVSQKYISRWYSKKNFTVKEISDALQRLASEAKVLTKEFPEGKNKTVTCYYDTTMPVTEDDEKEGDVAEKKELVQSPSTAQREVRSTKRKLDGDEPAATQTKPAEAKKRKISTKKEEKKEENAEPVMEVENKEAGQESEVPNKEETKETTEAKEEAGMEVEKEEEKAVSENTTPQQQQQRQEEAKQVENQVAKEEVGSAMEVVNETNNLNENLEEPTITNL